MKFDLRSVVVGGIIVAGMAFVFFAGMAYQDSQDSPVEELADGVNDVVEQLQN